MTEPGRKKRLAKADLEDAFVAEMQARRKRLAQWMRIVKQQLRLETRPASGYARKQAVQARKRRVPAA